MAAPVSVPIDQRFAQLIQQFGLTKNSFAISLGKTASVVQHLITNVRVDISGDDATTVCYLFNPLGYPGVGGKTEMLYCGGLYRDRLVRTPKGWRIRERVIETLYLDGKLPGS